MIKVKYPENIELKKKLRRGDMKLIAAASRKTDVMVAKVFAGTRRMKPDMLRVYDIIVRFNNEIEHTLGIRMEPEDLNKPSDKKPNV